MSWHWSLLRENLDWNPIRDEWDGPNDDESRGSVLFDDDGVKLDRNPVDFFPTKLLLWFLVLLWWWFWWWSLGLNDDEDVAELILDSFFDGRENDNDALENGVMVVEAWWLLLSSSSSLSRVMGTRAREDDDDDDDDEDDDFCNCGCCCSCATWALLKWERSPLSRWSLL